MRHIIRVLTFTLIPILVNGILAFMRQPQKAEAGKVHLHKFLGIFGTVCSVIFLIPAIVTAFADEPVWVPICFLAIAALSASLVVGFVNCRIWYDEEGFVSKNFFGVKRRFTYDQVTAIKQDMNESYIYMGEHRVMIDQLAVGGLEFILQVEKKYRTMHGGMSLPKMQKAKHDIFNGNVSDVGGFLFAYILLAVVVVAFLILSVYYVFFDLSTENNTIEQSVSFISCERNDENIVLTSGENQTYIIRFANEQFDANNIQAICDGKTVVTTYSTEVKPEEAEPYYSVKAILYNGGYLLSFDETNRFHRQEFWPVILLALGLCVLWGSYVAISIVVGRNPRKFSKKFVRLFFKDGYIKY